MNILTTGGRGFIGSHFIEEMLKTSNVDLILDIDKMTYAGNKSLPFDGDSRYCHYCMDINSNLLDFLLNYKRIDYVVHFAAESHVDNSILDSSAFITTNINGTHNLLESCRRTNRIKKFIHVSTDEVFGSLSFSEKPFDENSPYKPNSPYAASKASSDLLVRSYCKTHKFPAIITNCSNNFGPRQFPEKLIPLAINKLKENKQIPIYGNGKNIRDWIYVKDHVRALIEVLDCGDVGQQYLIGGDKEVSNIDIIKQIYEICKENFKLPLLEDYTMFVEDRKGHDLRYSIDCSTFKNKFKKFSLSDFEESLLNTVSSYI